MEHHTLGCVIFDLDGTLLDSMNVWSQIDRNLLNHYGKTAPDDLTEQVKKMTIQQSAQYFIDPASRKNSLHWYNPWQQMLIGTRCN